MYFTVYTVGIHGTLCILYSSDVEPDPDSFGSVDPDPYPVSESGSGSRGIKIIDKTKG